MFGGNNSPGPAGGDERPILFLSDAHFGVSTGRHEADRLDRFLRFLRHVPARASTLFLVGDLFDFWFEYAEVIPKVHALILAGLAALVRDGVRVRFIAGNHDFWIGPFLADSLGIEVSRVPIPLETQGRRLYVTHGDELTAGYDPSYRLLRRLVRSPIAIRAYHWLHPDLGIPLARWASGLSRGYSDRKKFVLNRTLERAIEKKFGEGYDGIVMGHIHYAECFRYGGGECVILGDWIEAFTYAELSGGRLALHRWEETSAP